MSVGVNLAGAEFGKSNLYGKDYIYPSSKDLDYFASKGVNLVRLPFKWERMQSEPFGELNPDELRRMENFLDAAAARGIEVVIDLHNYGRYDGQVLGSAQLPASALADFWAKLAAELEGHPGVAGYGLMNEPHDMGGAAVWPLAAQAAVYAIRTVDPETTIYVSGNDWSSAARWEAANPGFPLDDPSGSLIYEAHVYFDRDQSGTYKGTYETERAYPDIGVDRVKPFLNWLSEHNASGFIGEFGVPGDDPRWLEVLDRFLVEIDSACVDATYWAAGQWWGDYKLSVQPTAEGKDKPQIAVLEKYAGDPERSSNIPLPVAEVALGFDAPIGTALADQRPSNDNSTHDGAGNGAADLDQIRSTSAADTLSAGPAEGADTGPLAKTTRGAGTSGIDTQSAANSSAGATSRHRLVEAVEHAVEALYIVDAAVSNPAGNPAPTRGQWISATAGLSQPLSLLQEVPGKTSAVWLSGEPYPSWPLHTNGDGIVGILGFAKAGAIASFGGHGGLFQEPTPTLRALGSGVVGRWNDDQYQGGDDVNDDGRADVVSSAEATMFTNGFDLV